MRNGLILLFVCKMTVLTTIAQTSYYANYSHIFYTKKGGSFQISIPDKNKTYINTSTGQFVFNKPIYAKELLSINSSLNLEAATNCYINIKPRSSSYGLVIRKHDSNDFGNLKVTSLGLEFGYNTSTSNLIINTIGNVGVGGDPYSKLQVNTEGDPSFIEGEVRGNIQHGFQIWGTDQVMYMGVSTAKRVSYIQSVDMWTEGSTLALNSRGGSVTIGTLDAKGYKLAVAGNVIAEQICCKLQHDWPDFVFSENYPLLSLEEVESFIKEKKHLPCIPSSREVEDEGIDVGNMYALLLQKIEELTLYLIEQNKKIENLETQIRELK